MEIYYVREEGRLAFWVSPEVLKKARFSLPRHIKWEDVQEACVILGANIFGEDGFIQYKLYGKRGITLLDVKEPLDDWAAVTFVNILAIAMRREAGIYD